MKKGVLVIVAAAGLLILSLRNNCSAELRLGNFRIYPEIGVEEMYRSNIFQTEDNRKSDFITSILPGVRAQYLFGRNHSLDFGYAGDWNNYARHTGDNYWNHKVWGNLSLRFPGGLDLAAEHRYINNWLEKSTFVDHQRHFIEHVSGATAAYRFADRWKAQLQYTRDDYNMSSSRDRLYSYTSNLYGGSMFYRFTARTAGLVEYQHIDKQFDRGDIFDSRVNQVFLGLDFDPAGKLTGHFKFGYGWKEFDKRLAGRSTRSSTYVANANLVQNFTTYTSLGLSGMRAFEDDGDYGNEPLYRTAASLTLQHYFTTKIGATAMGSYNRSEYQEATVEPITGSFRKRTDNLYSAGIGVFYNVQKYLKARLDYNYITRRSNFETFSFDENRVMFKVVYSP